MLLKSTFNPWKYKLTHQLEIKSYFFVFVTVSDPYFLFTYGWQLAVAWRVHNHICTIENRHWQWIEITSEYLVNRYSESLQQCGNLKSRDVSMQIGWKPSKMKQK